MSTQLFGLTEHTDNKIVPIRSARLDQIERPNTLIAGRLFDHFASGGSVADAVRLVESLEHSPTADARAVVPASAKSRPKELPPDWAPAALDLTFARGEGLSDEAIRREEQAILLAPATIQGQYRQRMTDYYRKRKPYRDPPSGSKP